MFEKRLLIFLVLIVFSIFVTLSLIYREDYQKFVIENSNVGELKDWNDYELMRRDVLRRGFGENGNGVELTEPLEIAENEKLWKTFGMSVVISDKISVNRSVPDFRAQVCVTKKYPRNLPRVSIIIIFNNEVFSVFKRTLHSLYNRTPHELIEEVILVNDYSELKYLYEPLQNYIDEHFSGDINIKIINLPTRHGLMKARIVGAKAAKSDYLFVMEPHCEMGYNWLPPLIGE
jgi:polypeptide N-acetylgalactosaminyltransferase